MSVLHHESLYETCHDEAWEEFRISNKLSDDQLYALCEKSPTGTLDAIDALAYKKFQDLCQQRSPPKQTFIHFLIMSSFTYAEFQEVLNQLPSFVEDFGADLDFAYDWVADQIGFPTFASNDALYDQFYLAYQNAVTLD